MSFFLSDPGPVEIYTLSLHDALPILVGLDRTKPGAMLLTVMPHGPSSWADRKSTRLNSSHPSISYAVFCLTKKSAPVEHQRRHGEAAHRLFVPEHVGGDEQTDDPRIEKRVARFALAQLG